MSGPIRGKVARVLNSREVAINIGSEQGVIEGMYFDIMDPKGEDIRDPDTGEVLGSLERPKARVQVVRVQPRLSVASTYRKSKVNLGGGGGEGLGLSGAYSLARQLMPPNWITKFETFKTTEKTWEDLDEKESYVKTGDPVVQVMSDVKVEESDAGSALKGPVAF